MKKKMSIYEFLGFKEPKKKRSPNRRLNPPVTYAQEISQKKFGLTGKTIGLFKVIWPLTNQYRARAYRELHLLFRQIRRFSVVEDYPEYTVDYSTIRLAGNGDAGVRELEMAVAAEGIARLTWEHRDETFFDIDAAEAKVIVFVINETKHESHLWEAVDYPTSFALEIEVPRYSIGDKLHCWVFLQWHYHKRVSRGVYTQAEELDKNFKQTLI
jgi:hypothetical protein